MIMTEKRTSYKYLGIIIIIISLLIIPMVVIPTVFYLKAAPARLDITYNYETSQEEAIIIEHENIDYTSIYFSNPEFRNVKA